MLITCIYVGCDDDPKVIGGFFQDFLRITEAKDEYSVLGVDKQIAGCHKNVVKRD